MCIFDCCQDNDTVVDTTDIDTFDAILDIEANGLDEPSTQNGDDRWTSLISSS